MQLKVLPVTVDDAEELTKVFFSAFSEDHLQRAIYGPNRDSEAALNYYAGKVIETWGSNVAERGMKVVDEDTGEIAGHSIWIFPHKFTEEEKERREAGHFIPPTANEALFKAYFGELEERRKVNIDEEKDYVLHLIVVRPDYQGKGVGGLLLRWGLAAADEADARAFVEASPAGHPVYLKYGWQDIPGNYIESRLSDFGYEEMTENGGVSRIPCMMRPRKSERA